MISWPKNIRWPPFQLFLIRQRTVVATLGNMYTFALDINNSYYFVASLNTTYPQDFRNLWYPGSHNSQRLQVHETRVGWPLFSRLIRWRWDVCCWYLEHYVHICIRHQQSSNHLQLNSWMTQSRNSLYPSRHLDQFLSSDGWTTAYRDTLVGSLQLIVTAILEKITHFCIGQQYHNLPYLCLACITLGYAYFKEMNTLQIDLSGLQFWSQLLFWGVETCIWHKNPTYIHFLRPCVCLSIMDLLLNLDYLVCLSKIHISHCTHIVGILIFSCQIALRLHISFEHWSQSTELTVANSWKVLYKLLLKYEVCILLHYTPIDTTTLTSIKAQIIWLSVPRQISKGKKVC